MTQPRSGSGPFAGREVSARPREGLARHILLVGNFTPTSNRFCAELAERLTRSGWTALTASDKPARALRVLDMLSVVWKRRRDYSVAQVDVYSGLAFAWAEAVCWTLRRAGKPYVLTLHGGDLPRYAKRWPGRIRRLLGTAAAVTTPSSYLREHLKSFHEELQLLPNARDLASYPFRLRNHPQPHLLWLRRVQRMYNPVLAVETLARLVPEFPGARLTLVGPDSGDGTAQAVERAAVAKGVRERVTIVGPVPREEVPRRLNEGEIFLNTTRVDNTPLSVLEAMACGLPVVSTNVGGIPYLLEEGEDALLVPRDAPDAMAAAVRRILTEPGLAERLSRNARAKVESCDWSVILPHWLSLLERVLVETDGSRGGNGR